MSDASKDLELFHFGVKGMKWGVRRSDKQLESASKERRGIRQRIKDRDEGIQKSRDEQVSTWAREARALNNSVKAKGTRIRNLRDPDAKAAAKSATAARREATKKRIETDRSANRKTSKELAIRGATLALPVVLSVGYISAGAVGTRRNAKIGEKFKTDLFADTKGLPSPGTISLNLVNGVWQ